MNRFGIDEDWQRLSPAELLAAGKGWAVGYVSEDRTGKNITKAEVDAYRAAGVAVLLVYEYSATAISGGAAKGARDAGIAIAGARALGYPTGCVIAFAVDQNTSGNPAAVDAYCRAFTQACHAAGYRSMVYGGLATVRYALDHGLVDLAWQTYAWSGTPTVWDTRVAIRQVQNAVQIAGKAVDLDVAQVDDFGAWTQGGDMPLTEADAQLVADKVWWRDIGPEDGQQPAWRLVAGLRTPQPAPVALSDEDKAAIVAALAAPLSELTAAVKAIADHLAAAGHALDS